MSVEIELFYKNKWSLFILKLKFKFQFNPILWTKQSLDIHYQSLILCFDLKYIFMIFLHE